MLAPALVMIRSISLSNELRFSTNGTILTFLLNLFYTGSVGTFSPVSYMDRTGITLIRPLIYTPEKETKRFVKKNNLNVMSKVCPMDGTSKREDMKQMIFSLQKDIPMIRANLFGAIRRNLPDWK